MTGIPWPMSGPIGHLGTWSKGARRTKSSTEERAFLDKRAKAGKSNKSPCFPWETVRVDCEGKDAKGGSANILAVCRLAGYG